MAALVLAAFLLGIFWERKPRLYRDLSGLSGFSFCIQYPYVSHCNLASWCFSFPIFVILAFYAIDKMAVSFNRKAELVAVFLMFTLMLTNNGIMVYKNGEHVFQKGEANPAIAYLQEHVSEGEMVYVYYQSIPVTKYKIGYETERILAM